jgi:hypothetical protein
MVWGRGPSQVFCMWTSACASTTCWRDNSSSIEFTWLSRWKSIFHKCLALLLYSQFSSIVCVYYPYTSTTSFSFIVVFRSVSMNLLSLFFSKIVLLFGSLMRFRIGFSLSEKKKKKWENCCWNFDNDYTKSVDCLGWYCHLDNVVFQSMNSG